MNSRQVSKLKMYQVVISVCNNYATVYVHVPAFAACVGELVALEGAIKETSPRQAIANTMGVTKEKNNTGDILVQACLKVSNPLYVYALDKNNMVLIEKSNINKHTLYGSGSNKMLEIAKTIAEEAALCAAELVNYGVEAADLEALGMAVAAFDPLIAGPRTAIVGRKQQTGNLVQLFAATDSLLLDKMDRLIVPFKTSVPGFYTDYKNARNIIDAGAPNKPKGDNGQPPKNE